MRENRIELRDRVQQCLFNDAGAATFSSALLGKGALGTSLI